MAKLLVTLQGVALREVGLSRNLTTIGRRSRNCLVMDMLGVSGEHAVVRRCGADFVIEDLGSTNGTLVNGQPVTKQVLRTGDSIEIGEYWLLFIADNGEDSTGDPDRESPRSLPGTSSEEMRDAIPPARAVEDIPAYDRPRLRILSGAKAGREYRLRKVLTRLGRPGRETAAITRRADGYFIEHHRGEVFPKVNGVVIGSNARRLADHDVIEVAGVTIEFVGDRVSVAAGRRSQSKSEPESPPAGSEAIELPATPSVATPKGAAASGDSRASDRLGTAQDQRLPMHTSSRASLPLPQFATDRLRNLLNIRTRRAVPKRGPRPNPGARISFEDLRMTVQAGMTADLWRWLQDAGWREITYRPDRRHYCDIPMECVSELIECGAEERRDVLVSCIEDARKGRLPFSTAFPVSNR